MKTKLFVPGFLLALAAASSLFAFDAAEMARWQQRAQKITIVRDDWGIAHVYGKTDADAVFGMIYAQAEDDFHRIEVNYLNSMGRLAEAEGETKVYQDLRMKLFISTEEMKSQYAASPAWLKALMDGWAEGLNYYLAKHPGVKPAVIKRFEPWMALSFTEGSIGGDIERIRLNDLQAFYGKTRAASASAARSTPAQRASRLIPAHDDNEPRGSNGAAVAPANTLNKRALLLINPHTSFFFRSELQMVSEEGLNAYGAVTWGQFFIYQGFNDKAGWMHTSSGVDAVDEFLETVTRKGAGYVYKFGTEERPVTATEVVVPYKSASGIAEKRFTVYRTHHGPIIREQNGKWVAVKLMHEPIKALMQSYSRTKATSYKTYRETMELKANSSNNTIFADADGDIAYFHGNYIPKRDTRFDFTKPVDGSNPATDWQGLLPIDQTPTLLNPKSGWLYNTNNWPWSAAGISSPKRSDFPVYVESGVESARGLHAIRVLENKKDFTLESLIAAAYDSYLPWFEKTIPALVKAWDAAPAASKNTLTEQIEALKKWDYRWSVGSIPTSLAIFWGEEIRRATAGEVRKDSLSVEDFIATKASPESLLQALTVASNKLAADFGTWKTAWGDINRFQRLTADIEHPFNDAGVSIPVGFPSAVWGSLASFGARAHSGTKKWYGTSGNSFVAVVEFGEKVRAKAVTAGGESGHPGSKHFNDQAKRYSTGDLRDVYFYRDQLKGHTEREYHPGQ